MSKDASTDESFGPKLFLPEEPDHTWDLERLGVFARAKQEAILQGERSLTPLYWSLGMTLETARKQIGRGAWGRQLEEWGTNGPEVAVDCRPATGGFQLDESPCRQDAGRGASDGGQRAGRT